MTDGKHPGGRPPERVRVTVRKHVRGMDGVDTISHDLLWPKNWPMPTSYDALSVGPLGGFVERIEFDLDSERILITLRP